MFVVKLVVEDYWAIEDVHVRGMVFCVVVASVLRAWSPKNAELFLCSTILEPVVAHVHGFGAFVFGGFVGDANSGGVVGLDGCGWLWVSQFH